MYPCVCMPLCSVCEYVRVWCVCEWVCVCERECMPLWCVWVCMRGVSVYVWCVPLCGVCVKLYVCEFHPWGEPHLHLHWPESLLWVFVAFIVEISLHLTPISKGSASCFCQHKLGVSRACAVGWRHNCVTSRCYGVCAVVVLLWLVMYVNEGWFRPTRAELSRTWRFLCCSHLGLVPFLPLDTFALEFWQNKD